MVVETGKFLTARRNDFTESRFSESCTVFTEWQVFLLSQPKSHGTVKWDMVRYGQDITGEILNGFQRLQFFHDSVYLFCFEAQSVHRTNNEILWRPLSI